MSNRIISDVLTDSEKKGLTAPIDMFDRVINVSFLVQSDSGEMETYILRSDYEINMKQFQTWNIDKAINPEGGYIRRCTYKPSIKFSSRKITADGVSTQCILSIDNFYMISKDGKINRNLTTSGFKTISITVAMGYFSQFTKPANVAEFYTLNSTSGRGITILSLVPNEITVTGNAPNETLTITGYIGSSIETPIEVITTDESPDYSTLMTNKSSSEISKILEAFITYRFINYHSLKLSDKTSTDYIAYKQFKSQVKLAKQLKRSYVDFTQSFLDEHGVKFYLTEEAGKLTMPDSLKDSSGNSVTTKNVIPLLGITPVNTINLLNRYFNWDLQAYSLEDGNLLIYRKSEVQDSTSFLELSKKVTKEVLNYSDSVFKTFYNSKLPAVYTIAKSIEQITLECPFFAFVRLFEDCSFKSVYGNLNFTLALTDTANVSEFSVISQQIDFATVEDTNSMILKGVTKENE